MLSADLTNKLKRLRDHPIEFSPENGRFELRLNATQTVPKNGITRVLRKVFPVPRANSDDEDAVQPTKKARRSSNDPVPKLDIWHRTKPLTASMPTCKDATLSYRVKWLEPSFGAAGYGPNFNKKHGIVVDEQLKLFVARGRKALEATHCVDPCVATLLDHLRERNYSLVASQMPVYSADLDMATAFDIVFTDRATRDELHLGEVKATLRLAADDASYLRVRGRLTSSKARGTPLSDYAQHQLQLWMTDRMVKSMLDGSGPKSSRVLRVSANCVRTYELHPYFESRADKLLPVLKKRGKARGKAKRAKNPFLSK